MGHDFPQLMGKVIHHCGALELLTNNTIMALGTDPLLASEMVKAPFSRRLPILRRLLEDRSGLPASEVKSLCDELAEIARRRNAVAHNPIVRTDPDDADTEHIMVVRHGPEHAKVKEEIGREELRALVNRTKEAIVRFSRLVPESTRA